MKTISSLIIAVFLLISCVNNSKSNESSGDTTKISENKTADNTTVNENPKINDFIITNDGLGDIKLGMTINEIKKKLPKLKIEEKTSELTGETFYRITENDDFVCQITLKDEKVNTIFAGDKYKTEKGIGMLSSVGDLKKNYTVTDAFVEYGESSDLLYIKVKELPRVDILLNSFVNDLMVGMNNQELLKAINDDALINGFYIRDKTE